MFIGEEAAEYGDYCNYSRQKKFRLQDVMKTWETFFFAEGSPSEIYDIFSGTMASLAFL